MARHSAGVNLACNSLPYEIAALREAHQPAPWCSTTAGSGGQSQHSALLELEPKSDRIQSALTFARSNLKNPLTLDELAEAARLSSRLPRGDRSNAGQGGGAPAGRGRPSDAGGGAPHGGDRRLRDRLRRPRARSPSPFAQHNLWALNCTRCELGDAVVAVRQPDGHVKLNQLVNTTAVGAASGGMWGALVGLLFLNPLLGAAIGAGAGALSTAILVITVTYLAVLVCAGRHGMA